MKVVMQAHARDAAKHGTVGEAIRLLRDPNGHISVWVKWQGMPSAWVDLDDLLVTDDIGTAYGFEWQTTMQADKVMRGWSKDG